MHKIVMIATLLMIPTTPYAMKNKVRTDIGLDTSIDGDATFQPISLLESTSGEQVHKGHVVSHLTELNEQKFKVKTTKSAFFHGIRCLLGIQLDTTH